MSLQERAVLARSTDFQLKCTLAFVRRAEQIMGLSDAQIAGLPGVNAPALSVRTVAAKILDQAQFQAYQFRFAILVASDPNITDDDAAIQTRVDEVIPDLVPAADVAG